MMTSTEPALCTNAPTTGFKIPMIASTIATKSVSYTHLDVYKRQSHSLPDKFYTVFSFRSSSPLFRNFYRYFTVMIPVSYTHLDVYKRQLIRLCDPFFCKCKKWFFLCSQNTVCKHISMSCIGKNDQDVYKRQDTALICLCKIMIFCIRHISLHIKSLIMVLVLICTCLLYTSRCV